MTELAARGKARRMLDSYLHLRRRTGKSFEPLRSGVHQPRKAVPVPVLAPDSSRSPGTPITTALQGMSAGSRTLEETETKTPYQPSRTWNAADTLPAGGTDRRMYLFSGKTGGNAILIV